MEKEYVAKKNGGENSHGERKEGKKGESRSERGRCRSLCSMIILFLDRKGRIDESWKKH